MWRAGHRLVLSVSTSTCLNIRQTIQVLLFDVPSLLPSPQLATRLLAHKIQSPQEWEAMQALMVSIPLSG